MSEIRDGSIRVVLIEDHPLICEGMRLVFSRHPGLNLAGAAAHRAAALNLVAREQPDLILLDLALADCQGLELLPELRLAARQARILILTASDDRAQHCAALRLGALGIVLKEQPVEILLRAIERVLHGETWLDQQMMSLLLERAAPEESDETTDAESQRIALLTDREREVVALVGRGFRNKRIADQLCISEVTVRHHLTSIFNKLQLSDRLELLIYAYQHDLARLPDCVARGDAPASDNHLLKPQALLVWHK
jgi:DNA-binding NarL/FixJ family response regulator